MSSRRWIWLLAVAAALSSSGCSPESERGGEEADLAGALDSEEATTLRQRMVAGIVADRPVTDARVQTALRKVPRHLFAPKAPLLVAYDRARPFSIGEGQTISSAEIVALMTSLLELKGTEKVLEIGTGSGYQAAILAELVPHVYTIEILPALGRMARERLEQLGYENVHMRIGDGYRGWPEQAPFDAIIVTAAPPETPPALLQQLAPGGRLIVPVGERHQTQWLTLHRKDADGTIHTKTGIPVRFVPMVHGEDR